MIVDRGGGGDLDYLNPEPEYYGGWQVLDFPIDDLTVRRARCR